MGGMGGMGDFDLSQLQSLANFQQGQPGGDLDLGGDSDDEDDMPELVAPKAS